jgi:hypothetical protein
LLPLGVAAARRAFGSGIPVAVPRVPVPAVLAVGAIAPALSGLGVPPELLEAASTLGAVVASYTIGTFMADAVSRRAQTALAAIALVTVAVVGPHRVGWLLIEIVIAGGFAAHLALRPPTAGRWRRTVRRRRAAPAERKDVWS